MTITTKLLIVVLWIGAIYNAIGPENYKEAFQLVLIIVVILQAWYNERVKREN